MTGQSRRIFLTCLVAAPTLALVTRAGADALAPQPAHAVVPSLPAIADVIDLGDLFILAGAPTSALLALAVASSRSTPATRSTSASPRPSSPWTWACPSTPAGWRRR
ncbi:hypothetical protein [Streptomyces sp. NPDC002587]